MTVLAMYVAIDDYSVTAHTQQRLQQEIEASS